MGRKARKKSRTRPRKNNRERKQRNKVQKSRLIALGVPEDVVNKMDSKQVKELLKRPARIGVNPKWH